ncbi:Flp family type IVb pilin [Sphingomonas koreensis]|uniref:Flp family type IVb pilin n=1 Tax=Sphingomonas koreensis TaxID=93064 RepID=UPI0009FD971E|nr:Flp family type IVb pilin [Sphingomonas koreensis]PJI90268.1 pilus assembly protein Flp/PilA [Sphingomonas koreensis]RSU61258.1 Flp family type IVb pilin [Sphingomonas koreensis]RSU69902.1 Flp family type IVb pilin [Sphingomonas koreensis]
MRVPTTVFSRLLHCRRAATAVEYGLILALIVLALMGALIGLADVTTSMWTNVSDAVQTAR